ncbi:MAG: hypothetical protein ATN33_04395 [Epulopiscium sp. Nele67-Bin001]|nr:MAG: hypothetical protein ATN33_04395 [Epulopiscium sp. Nele67-Bin001]
MDFKELNYLIALADFQQMTKAAEQLFISQPSLSKYIKTLEDSLGIKLFNKVGNRFVLTYAGECYVESARKILNIRAELDAKLSDIRSADVGRLNIGVPHTRASYLLPLVLPRFTVKYPKIQLNIFEDNVKVLEDALLNGKLDIALLMAPLSSSTLDYEVLNVENIYLVICKDHPMVNCSIDLPGSPYPLIDLNLFKTYWPNCL